ncbi:hypothetical protein [Micromonospora sp. NPDC004551]|uniref:hypothetical protein n=1 Tax=Micromonospora sp. NPDC004551 TaxID=3154284 RepID=UPI0033AC73B7
MTWDEERASRFVRRTLTQAHVPPSRVDVGAVLDAGRRSERRRRRLTVGLAAVAVLVVGLGSTVVVGRSGHDRGLSQVTDRPPEILPTATLVPVTVDIAAGAAAPCRYEQYPVPEEAWFPRVSAADPSGRVLAGRAEVSNKAVEQVRSYLLLWDRGRPSLIDLPEVRGATVNAVNASGVVVGTSRRQDDESRVSWVYRDGRLRHLSPPPGYDQTLPLAVNDRGDILGISSAVGRGSTPVVWPAGSEGPPRILRGPDRGRVIGWTADGTVVWFVPEPSAGVKVPAEIRFLRADGSSALRPVPAGWSPGSMRFEQLPMRGDWVAGIIPGAGEKSPPAVLNLRTGELIVYHGLDTRNHFSVVARPDGGVLAGVPGQGWKLVDRDGTTRSVPLPAGADPEYGPQPLLIDDAGTIHGAVHPADPGSRRADQDVPTVWRCR